MKIVHYLPHLLLRESGPGSVVFGLSQALVRSGMEVRWVVSRDPARLPVPDGIESVGVDHRYRKQVMVPVNFESVLADADVLVLHGGWVMWNIAAGRSARRMGVPCIVCAHGVYYPEVLAHRDFLKRAWLALLERRFLNSLLGIHIFFPEEEAHLQAIGVWTPTLVVPNGYDPPKDVTWDGGSGGYLLWFGRFDPRHKGIDLLVRALEYIPPDERPSVKLHGTEWGDGKHAVQNLVKELKLEPWVAFGAPIYGQEKWDVLARAGAFTYPSRWDACPIAPAEAVSVGVPTLVTDFPMGRLFSDEGAAIVAGRSPRELAEGIQRVLSDPGKEVARRGPSVVARLLNWDVLARSWLEQLENLMGSPSAKAASTD